MHPSVGHAPMLRIVLVSSLLLLAAPTAMAHLCLGHACVEVPNQPPHCHMWDACGADPCDPCGGDAAVRADLTRTAA